jgi:hypothetical protein
MKSILLVLPLILFMTGCQTMAQIPKYSVVVTNGTTNLLTYAMVKYGDFESLGGSFPPGRKKVDELVPFPIPKQATVLWKSQDGESHEKLVEVQKALPKDFSDGDIIFTILEGDKVEVTYKPFFKLPK